MISSLLACLLAICFGYICEGGLHNRASRLPAAADSTRFWQTMRMRCDANLSHRSIKRQLSSSRAPNQHTHYKCTLQTHIKRCVYARTSITGQRLLQHFSFHCLASISSSSKVGRFFSWLFFNTQPSKHKWKKNSQYQLRASSSFSTSFYAFTFASGSIVRLFFCVCSHS